MRVQASEISARQAAEVVENSAKARDKVIEDAKRRAMKNCRGYSSA